MTNSNDDHSFFANFSKIFEDIFNKDFSEWTAQVGSNFGVYIPAVNIRETPTAYEFEMTAPGREKADFTIKFHEGKLSVAVPRKDLRAITEGERFRRKEFAYPSFNRQFNFPKYAVDDTNIKARYESGILKIKLPKQKEAEADDGIEISVK